MKTGWSRAKKCGPLSNTKVKSKWIKGLNIRPEFINSIQENIGITLHDTEARGIFNNSMLLARLMEVQINNWDYMKQKSFCTLKETGQNKKTLHRLVGNIYSSLIIKN